MSEQQLTGRALDEAVAKAMGWTVTYFPESHVPHIGHWSEPGKTLEQSATYCRAYSTEAACLPEMLDWLTRASELSIEYDSGWWWAATFEMDWKVTGSSISDAVAQLVLVESERRLAASVSRKSCPNAQLVAESSAIYCDDPIGCTATGEKMGRKFCHREQGQ